MSRIVVSVFLLFVLCQLANGHGCYKTIPVSCDAPSHLSGQPSSYQGPPGKRGPLGPVGRRGPPGEKGEPGEGANELAVVIERKMQELQDQLEKVKAAHGGCLAGMKSGAIRDERIKGSGYYREIATYHPSNGRLDQPLVGWAPASNSASDNHWIQVDLLGPRKIQGVVLQGAFDRDQWVTGYKVMYGDHEHHLTYIVEDTVAKVFPANSDRHTHVRSIFGEEITARFVRVVPATWHSYPVMRFDLISC